VLQREIFGLIDTIASVHSEIPQRRQCDRLVPEKRIDHHVADMTASFAGDVTLREAQEKLATANQWLPFDGDDNATLASLIENNSTGPLRLGFGAWRDNLLGVQFMNGRDELITAGGRVVKNVAGYDFTRFMVGQYGVFGKIITLTTRTYLRPTQAILAAFDPDLEKFNAPLVTSCRPHWAVLTPEALLLGYLGDERATAFYTNALKAYSPDEVIPHPLVDDITARAKLWNAPSGVEHLRAMVPPASIRRFVEQAQLANWVADPAFGVVKASGAMDASLIHKSAADVNGHAVLFDVQGKPTNLKLDPDVRSLLDKLKSAFDPENTLVPLPGRL
jgi:FAD/FMN-containing dehydrogenase